MDIKQTINSIVENLFYAIPVIHKRLMRIDPPDINCGIRLSRQHIGILAMLSIGSFPIKEIGITFMIPKPRMTYLVNQMEKAGLIRRSVNDWDRRITNLKLTPKGRDIFRRCDEHLKNNVKDILADLTEKELDDLAESLKKLKEIGPKFDDHSQLTEAQRQ
jgi:DNA-binding MarR family transcriptional regulator